MISQVDNVASHVLVMTNCRFKYADAIATVEFNSTKATTFLWLRHLSIGLYRENAIAIESEAGYPNVGNMHYVTMQITFPIPEASGIFIVT